MSDDPGNPGQNARVFPSVENPLRRYAFAL